MHKIAGSAAGLGSAAAPVKAQLSAGTAASGYGTGGRTGVVSWDGIELLSGSG
jgi:hypothetical protein